MEQNEFYIKMNDFLQQCGINRRNGYETFIRLSYRKYKNPTMKIAPNHKRPIGRNFYKIIAALRGRGKYNEYFALISGINK